MARTLRGLAGASKFPPAYWTQPYRPVPFPGFGKGLNLRDQPDAVPGDAAIDCLDVDLTQRGAAKQRYGYGKFTSVALTNRVDSLWPIFFSSGTRQLLCGCGTRIEALNTGGAVVASATGLAGGPYGFARYGQPNTEVVYAGNGTDTLRKWDAAAWTAPTATVDAVAGRAMPKAGAIAVYATSNRMAASGFATTTGGPNAATSSPSHVYFSEAGNPEAWMVTSSPAATPPTYANSIQLTPGDGEKIQNVVAYQNLLIVFKESKFFTFHGESVAADGSPTFNYRTVDTGIGLVSPKAVCVGRDGVYFMARTGIYKTTGLAPELVSGVLDPLFIGALSGFYSGAQFNQANAANVRMWWHEERLYVSLPTTLTTNDRMLVFDPRFNWWTIYSIPASAGASFQIGSQPEVVFGYPTGTNDVGRHNSTFTTDDGTNIASFWKSGWYDMGSPDIKTIREAKLFGAGKMQIGWAKDFRSGVLASNTVNFNDGILGGVWGGSTWGGTVWGGGNILAEKLVRSALRGTTFSLQIQAFPGQSWTLERVTQHVREEKVATDVKVDA